MKIKGILLLAVVLSIGLGIACSKKNSSNSASAGEESAISHYTCPMHPQIHEDHPGECPICHMKLVPVYKEDMAEDPSGGSSIKISPEKQQLIGVKTEIAQKKKVTKEIRTVGHVAFDPELAVAQKEFLEISKSVPSLRLASHSRLRLMGMSEEEIQSLEKNGKTLSNLYLPEPNESVWVYATLFQDEVDSIKSGQKALISSGSDKTFPGTVRAVDPTIDPMTRSARARIEVPHGGGFLKPDGYVNVVIHVDLGEVLTVSKSAILDTGVRKVAFVVQEDSHFQTRDIRTGPESEDQVVILDGIQEGEKVAKSAVFLIDSESQLKAAVSGMGSDPTCPEGEVWDRGMAMCM